MQAPTTLSALAQQQQQTQQTQTPPPAQTEQIELDVTFKVYGTFEQLTALNNYLKENGFKYEQIN